MPTAELLRPPREPGHRPSLAELRAVADLLGVANPLRWLQGRQLAPRKQVIVLPGFGADDRWTWPLRRYLGRLGHSVEGWGEGRNLAGIDIRHRQQDLPRHWGIEPRDNYRGEGGVIMLCERMRQRVERRAAELTQPIWLLGWSLGGYIAREVARDLPQQVAGVITLGTPVLGGPKYSVAAGFFRRRGMDLDWIEREIARRESSPIRVALHAIVSRSDGIVDPAACIDRQQGQTTHSVIDAAHIGLVFNRTVWRAIASVLER